MNECQEPVDVPIDFSWSTPFVFGPAGLFILTLLIGIPRYFYNQNHKPISSSTPTSFTKTIIYLCIFVTLSFLADAFVIITRVCVNNEPWTFYESSFYISVSWLSWILSLFLLVQESQFNGKWYWSQYLFWQVSFLTETIVGWLWLKTITKPNEGTILSFYDQLSFGIFLARYVTEVLIVILSMIHLLYVNNNRTAESSPLLSASKNKYGTVITADNKEDNNSTFKDFFKKIKMLLPYIWPNRNFKLQFYIVLCFILMSFGFLVNLLAPRQIGHIVDEFKQGKIVWASILIYVGFKFLQGGSGLLQILQNWCWIPISQYSTQEISVKTFSHLHHLSLDFHLGRKTGEVLRIMDRGTNSVVSLLNQILFQIFPICANITLITIYTTYIYAPSFGIVLLLTMILYIYVTIAITEWRTKFRRDMIDLDNYARTKAVDSLLNFETVKYNNAEEFEIDQYKRAIQEYQQADWKSSISLNVLNLAQNAIISGGLLFGCLLFGHKVAQCQLSAGDFVAFNMYLIQLYTPLHWFGTYYRMIQSNFIDMEKMFDLLDQVQTVQDDPYAKDLIVTNGDVVFDNVSFSYDGRQTALNGISFRIPKGATVALVGPSGGGKSTILRLLFRFYDPTSGHIYIDGQDIRKVTQVSLRKNVGVVPQDTMLFNDTVYYNIHYGDINADRQDVIRAAKAAHIHHKIESFPDGYDTKVGERGLRLSGGEKQRVAIARTILKDPPIILLDEATSALDTTTERHIQRALSNMTKDRTTLVIAHRLSTIVNADLILVIKDGQVVESGTHEELINKELNNEESVYYEMWQKQLHDDTTIALNEVLSSSSSTSSRSSQSIIRAKKSIDKKKLNIDITRDISSIPDINNTVDVLKDKSIDQTKPTVEKELITTKSENDIKNTLTLSSSDNYKKNIITKSKTLDHRLSLVKDTTAISTDTRITSSSSGVHSNAAIEKIKALDKKLSNFSNKSEIKTQNTNRGIVSSNSNGSNSGTINQNRVSFTTIAFPGPKPSNVRSVRHKYRPPFRKIESQVIVIEEEIQVSPSQATIETIELFEDEEEVSKNGEIHTNETEIIELDEE